MREVEFKDWRLTLFWIAVAAAGVIAGFVAGWCWRDRPGAISDVRLLDVLVAFGTIGSAITAVWIANRIRGDSKKASKIKAVVYIWKINPFVGELGNFFAKELRHLHEDGRDRAELREKLEKVLARLESLEMEALLEFDYHVCVNLVQVRNGIQALLALNTNIFHDDGVIRHSFESMLKLARQAKSRIENYDGDRYLR